MSERRPLPPSFAPQRPAPRPRVGQDGTLEPAAPPPSPATPPSPRSPEAAAPRRAAAIAPRAAAPASPARAVTPASPVEPAPQVSSGLEDRLAEKRAARRRLRMRSVIGGAVVVVLLAVAGWLVYASPVLAVRADQITIVGAGGTAPEDQVREAAVGDVGVPLLRLDTGATTKRIEALPGVRHAVVTREWPNGMRVEITPRTAVAAVPGEGGVTLVDGDGVTLGTAEAAPEGLPAVDIPLGEPSTAAALTAVLTVLDALPADLLAQVRSAGATGPDGVTLTLHSGAAVIWGSAQESALKAKVLATLVANVQAHTYDVSAPRTPITS